MGDAVNRCPDWQDRLAAYLASREGLTFHWAVNSCMTFATGAVTAMTGRDPWAVERARLAALRRRGRVIRYMHRYGAGLEGAADRALAQAGLVPVSAPAEGDIVLARVGAAITLGVCLGRLSAFIGTAGIQRRTPDTVLAAWGIR